MSERAPQLTDRIARVWHGLLDHVLNAPDRQSNHYRPSAQRDVGKSAVEASAIQLTIDGLNERPVVE